MPPRPARPRWLLVIGAAAALLAASAPCGGDDDATRAFLGAVNRGRAALELPALRPSDALSAAAGRWADAAARAGTLDLEPLSAGDAGSLGGYDAHRLVQVAVHAGGTPAQAAADWAEQEPSTFDALLDPALGDIGIGTAQLGSRPLYVLVAAESEERYYAPVLDRLADLAQVRRELGDLVNAERRERGLPVLERDDRLDLAAQRHAERMLAEDFFGHLDPHGSSVLDRVLDAGYPARRAGENLAAGQQSPEAVIEDWLSSPAHRDNLLSGDDRDIGFGVAAGGSAEGVRIIWVQISGVPAG